MNDTNIMVLYYYHVKTEQDFKVLMYSFVLNVNINYITHCSYIISKLLYLSVSLFTILTVHFYYI